MLLRREHPAGGRTRPQSQAGRLGTGATGGLRRRVHRGADVRACVAGWPALDCAAVTEAWLDELAEWIRIPSSAPTRRTRPTSCGRASGSATASAAAGGEAELVDWEGQPLAIGEIRASTGADEAPTVLCYGHFDVQPPDPLELWESDAVRADDPRRVALRPRHRRRQGPALPAAEGGASSSPPRARCPVNLRFACDGEEETGGHSIVDFLAADERGADAAVIFDSDMVARGVPAFNVATRGLCYFHLSVRTGERDLHSGMYGGAALTRRMR